MGKNKRLRVFARRVDRLTTELNKQFDNHIQEFHHHLFLIDWDSAPPDVAEWKIFQAFNDGWLKFCNAWDAHNGRFVRANPHVFYNYAISQHDEYYETDKDPK